MTAARNRPYLAPAQFWQLWWHRHVRTVFELHDDLLADQCLEEAVEQLRGQGE
jgi:hypothetical protein